MKVTGATARLEPLSDGVTLFMLTIVAGGRPCCISVALEDHSRQFDSKVIATALHEMADALYKGAPAT